MAGAVHAGSGSPAEAAAALRQSLARGGGHWVRAALPGAGVRIGIRMKEDKENARPKERRGTSAAPGVLLAAGPGTGPGAGTDGRAGVAELDRLERPKDKKETLSKVGPARRRERRPRR